MSKNKWKVQAFVICPTETHFNIFDMILSTIWIYL